MAYTLPNTMAPDEATRKEFGGISNFYNDLVKHAALRAQNRRAEEQNTRLNDLHPLQRLLLNTKAQNAQSNADWNNMLMGNPSQSSSNQASNNNQMVDENGTPQNTDAVQGIMQNRQFPNTSNQSDNQFNSNEPSEINNQNGYENNQDIGQEKIISPGNPKLENMNKYAGIKGVPALQTHYDANGNLITRFPNGKITMQKVGPSGAETKAQEEQTKFDITKRNSLQEELPLAEELIKKIEHAKETIEKHPEFFGPGVGGVSFLGGPNKRKRDLKTKESRKKWGEIEDLFGNLVGKKAQDYSHKGLKVAFDLASITKPSFDEWPETVTSKLDEMLNPLKAHNERELDWYENHGGKSWKGSDKEGDELLKKWGNDLIKINPEWTTKNIKHTAKEERMSVGKLIDQLMSQGG